MIAACKVPCKTTTFPARAPGRSDPRLQTSRSFLAVLSLVFFPWSIASGVTPDSGELPYHNGPTLICADCHEFAAGAGEPSPNGTAGPGAGNTPGHLRFDDLNELCLSCHGGVPGTPDVLGADVNGLRERSAGRFETVDSENRHGHDLGPSFTCASCHDPHGGGNPRNLRLPSDPDAEVVLGLFVRRGAAGLERYERRNVAYGTLDSPALREVSALCLDCHGSVLGPAAGQRGSHGGYLRHPSYDSQADHANRISDGSMRGSTAAGYWDLGSGPDFEVVPRVPFVTAGAEDFVAAAQVDAGRNGVFCLSCHSAHGTGNRFGLRWSQTGGEGVAGCNQCHAKGRQRTADQLTQMDPVRN